MQPDLASLAIATGFTAGCVAIHAFRHRSDDVTMILVLVMAGLLNLTGAAMLSRTGPTLDPAFAAELASYRTRHDR